MATTEPIRKPEEIQKIVNYFIEKDEMRNYALVKLGLHTALRIGDILSLKWGDLYDFDKNVFKDRFDIVEQKTGKSKIIALNKEVIDILELLKNEKAPISGYIYIFRSKKGVNRPISREQAYKIIKKASRDVGIDGNISCHSLRKTFGYYAWKRGVPQAVIMDIYNHTSLKTTRRYLGIEQDDRDNVYLGMDFSYLPV